MFKNELKLCFLKQNNCLKLQNSVSILRNVSTCKKQKLFERFKILALNEYIFNKSYSIAEHLMHLFLPEKINR